MKRSENWSPLFEGKAPGEKLEANIFPLIKPIKCACPKPKAKESKG